MKRRQLLTATCAATFLGLNTLPSFAQVRDLSDAINKAGQQRALSQRMSKAWLMLVVAAEKGSAQRVLDKSLTLFDRHLGELKAFAPNPAIKATYGLLDASWSEFKTILVGASPAPASAPALLALDSKVLALAQQGTEQYEAALNQPLGKLVNLAGRQRMLSQRMAKFYLAANLPADSGQAAQEINLARTEFINAMSTLRNAPEANSRIKDELRLADGQWLFFDNALKKMNQGTATNLAMSDVFVASENLLSVMENVTNLYASLKT